MLWTRLVVVSELPVERATLLLRLLGAGQVLQQAITEPKALPAAIGARSPRHGSIPPLRLRAHRDVRRTLQARFVRE